MAPNPRVVQAFRAMKEIGIPEERTKPVLKKLLKVYEKNWELIEQENYRVLADAIFDSDESEVAEQQKKLDEAEAAEKKKVELAERMKAVEEETQIPEEPEKPLKRLRVRHQDDQASPSCINPNTNSGGNLLKKPKSEIIELPESQPELQSPVAITVTGPVLRSEPHPVSPLKQGRDNGEQSDLRIILFKPKDEPLTDSPPNVEVPLALTMTDLGPDYSGEPPVNADAISPTENRFEENNHFVPDETIDIDKGQESVVSTDAVLPTDSLQTRNDFEKETENGVEENNHFVPDETISITKGQESMVNTDAISPTDPLQTRNDFEEETEIGVEENSHFVPAETIDMVKGEENVVDTDAISPTDSLKTRNEFEKETENGVEENSHFVPDKTIDIAKGEENVVISLVNEVNSQCPPSFHYIPRNAIFQNAYVNFSLARITKENCCSTCFGNCLTSSTPCPCALQTGGEFAYTNEGTIKGDILDDCIQTNRDPKKIQLLYCKECPLEKPKNEGVLGTCKGHIDRSFIKECWLKCGCNKKCGNRVVQCGIRHKLQVFMTPNGKGWGLRSLEDLPKGAFVCEFVGEVLTCKELYSRVSQSSKNDEYAYSVFLDAEWVEENDLKEDEALCLDATSYGNVARFINHRCFDPNLVEIPVEVENPDRHYYHLAFFTTRKVKALEELTRDYGINFDDIDDPIKAFKCQCGSPGCRNTKGSSGTRKRKCAQS